MTRSSRLTGVLFGSLILHAMPCPAQVSTGDAPARSISLMIGSLSYDRGDDSSLPMVAVLTDWRLSNHVAAQTAMSHAWRPAGERSALALTTATAGVLAELDLRYVRPYTGIAAGLFGRFGPPGDDRFVRTTIAFPAGLRAIITRRILARAEVRFRFDEHQDGGAAADAELSLGLGWRF